MALAISSDYVVYSNPESGKGRSNCLIKPTDKEKYATVIEFKHRRGEPMCSPLPPIEPMCSPPAHNFFLISPQIYKTFLKSYTIK